MKALLALALFVGAACGGAVSGSGSPTPSAAASSPAATASPVPTAIVLPSFAQLSAPSANVVWALVAGTRLFVSSDRGASWDERALPANVGHPVISFVSDRDGWIARGDADAPCLTGSRALWRTSDGAKTWRQVDLSSVAGATCASGLSFTDARRGYLAGLDPYSGPVVHATADGGVTWSASRPLSDPPGLPMQGGRADMLLGPVHAFDGTLLLATTVRSAAILPEQYVYSSGDGGRSWTYKVSVPLTGALVFVSADRWLRIGAAGASVESTDAGATWHAYATDYAQAAPSVPEIVFADTSVGYATVRGAIQRTSDGGAHWLPIDTPGTR